MGKAVKKKAKKPVAPKAPRLPPIDIHDKLFVTMFVAAERLKSTTTAGKLKKEEPGLYLVDRPQSKAWKVLTLVHLDPKGNKRADAIAMRLATGRPDVYTFNGNDKKLTARGNAVAQHAKSLTGVLNKGAHYVVDISCL